MSKPEVAPKTHNNIGSKCQAYYSEDDEEDLERDDDHDMDDDQMYEEEYLGFNMESIATQVYDRMIGFVESKGKVCCEYLKVEDIKTFISG